MNRSDRDIIQSNLEKIANAINLNQLAPLLKVSNIFNRRMIDHLDTYQDETLQKLCLLSDLQTRGPRAFQDFVGIVQTAGCNEALDILVPGASRSSKFPTPSRSSDAGQHSMTNFQLTSERTGVPPRPHLLELDQFNQQRPSGDNGFYVTTATDFINPHNSNLDDENRFANFKAAFNAFTPAGLGAQRNLSPSQSCLSTPEDEQMVRDLKQIGAESSNQVPAEMTVKPSLVWRRDPNEDYKMTSQPRGICLLINNVDFEDSHILPKRKGSDEDARRFDYIFQQLGFEVMHRRNLTSGSMKMTFKSVANSCKAEHDALFVIILSHGTESGFFGVDGIEVDLNTMLRRFDNRRCKSMLGKPKVFVVQACRGRLADYGDGDTSDSGGGSPRAESPGSSSGFDKYKPPLFKRLAEFVKGPNKGSHPIRTDMLLCFSCLGGYTSNRNEAGGSWLGLDLAYHLMTSACDKDLLKILNLVSGDIRHIKSSEGHTQAIEVTQIGWDKNLYFNPGLYD